ncbi:hypothetical protein ACFU9O_13060 [Streptomyces albidoflavus]|uniref:hypothetical protein n=1 Tax=Streptomyces TaxID=1883 RepID=UPI000FD64372|nr:MULTISPECIES: hypothetical protein [Streptomyces]
MTVLDEPQKVAPGEKFTAKSEAFNPRSAEIKQTRGKINATIALRDLERELDTEVARPGKKTSSERRVMSATFETTAQAVYYRGVKAVTASYSYKCNPNEPERTGEVYTWDITSPTTGLADCLSNPSGNSDSELARLAISRNCPAGTAARKMLDGEQVTG